MRLGRTLAALAVAWTAAAASGAAAAPDPNPAPVAYIGEVRAFAFSFCPQGWAPADGSLLQISQNAALFSLIGVTYGGNGATTFALPDLRGLGPIGASSAQPLGAASGAPAGTPRRFLAMTWCIALQASFPQHVAASERHH